MVTSFICIHTKVCIYSIKETVCNRAKAGSELPESVAPILQNGGSQSPDRWLKEPRNNHCEYITEHRNLFITGATGCGKTYMACAFGMEACKQYFNTRYVRLPDLLIDLELARTDGTYKKVMAKYANPLVLILDEWLLLKPTRQNNVISSNSCTGGGRNHPPSSAPSMSVPSGMTSLVGMQALLPMPS